MGKRSWSLVLAAALIAGVFTVVPAKADGVGELKFFLRSTGCPVADVNFDYLSITDGDDAIECNYTGSGIRNEIGGQTGTVGAAGNNAVADRETGSRYWDATDGGPLMVDVSRPVTGTIFTSGIYCAQPTLCAPGGGSVGQAILDVTLVGLVGETETELGTQTDTFQVVPGAPHATELKISVNATATGLAFDKLELRTWVHGMAAGHNVIRTNADTSSFISIPTASAAPVVSKPKPPKPTKPKPTPKKCKNGHNDSNSKKCKPKKPSEPTPPATPVGCPAYVPGDAGKEAKTSLVTDAATAEKPVVVEFDSEMGGPSGPLGAPVDLRSLIYQNIQVDTAAAEAGLYVRIDFPEFRDYDLYLKNADGSDADISGDTNLAPGELGCGGTSCEGGTSYESILGIRTPNCGGYTAEIAGYMTEGGKVTLSAWLGEIKADPAPPGALQTFYTLMGL